tara:strand:- start:4 stop:2001 length:1998 start_codon:yes stop_codon:yes gene_type:complete
MQLMAKMAEQMELFEPVERGFNEGGLMDEGGTVDPVSGNDVPPGSTQEEVRDDIPAQLSEGEFVVPADVVRYIGLENLMRMRQEAKQGLAEMEAMGQMGNSEQAVMPDDLPFDEYDLEVEDDGLEMNTGGFVSPFPPNQVNPMTGVYQTGSTGITGFQNYQGQPTGFTPYGGATPFFQPTQFTGPQYTTALQTTNLPTFAETVGSQAGQYDELKTYQNDAGQTLQIPFKNGQPIYPVPEGYIPIVDQPKPEEISTTVTPTLGQAQVSDAGDDRGEDKTPSTATSTKSLKDLFSGKSEETYPALDSFDTFSEAGLNPSSAFGGSKYGTQSSAYAKGVASLGSNQIGSTSPLAGIASGVGTKLGYADEAYNPLEEQSMGAKVTRGLSFGDRAVAGNQARNTALGALGMIDPNQMYSKAQADFVGGAMTAAMEAQEVGADVTEAVQNFMSSPSQFQTAAVTVRQVARAYLTSKPDIEGYRDVMSNYDLSNLDTLETLTRLEGKQDIRAINEALEAEFGSSTDFSIDSDTYDNLSKNVKNKYNSYKSAATPGATPTHNLTRAARMRKDRAIANKKQIEEITASVKAANKAEKERAEREAAVKAARAEAAEAAGYQSGKDYSDEKEGSFAGLDKDQAKSAAMGSNPGDKSVLAKGGLATQMKRSGLASKK